jgi:hypothetical protein
MRSAQVVPANWLGKIPMARATGPSTVAPKRKANPREIARQDGMAEIAPMQRFSPEGR